MIANSIADVLARQNARRPQLNHRVCQHEATPAARRACREAFWAAKEREAKEQTEAAAVPALTATYKGMVAWTDGRGRTHKGHIVKDLGAGRMLIETTSGRPAQVAFTSLRLV